jgi:colanic acid/amylovoran biosynthesis glycosyltransferase
MQKEMKILYIGNNLTRNSKYNSTYTTLSNLLEQEQMEVYRTSSIQNKILRLLDMLWQVVKYRKKVDSILIDTFSTSNFYYALLTSQLARIFRIKYIPILHGGNLPKRLDKNPILSKWIFKNSYQNVAPSGYLKYEFEKRGYTTQFIPNVLNIDEYLFTQRKKIKPNLLWVRAFAHLYNPAMAIKVLKELKKDYPNATLCMVGPDKGDGSFQETQNLVNEYRLEDSVIFTGVLPKEEWHKLSENYDIFINTTTIDNTPVSVMEAMALGLPIVSTNVGGLSYLILEDEGVLVENQNVEEMTLAIIQLLNSSENVGKLTKNAKKKVASFDWSVVREKWLQILT